MILLVLMLAAQLSTDQLQTRFLAGKLAAQNLIRLAVLAGDDSWRDKADRLIAAIAPLASENLYMHMALLNAVDLRLRAAQIVVTGQGSATQALLCHSAGKPESQVCAAPLPSVELLFHNSKALG